MPKKITDRLKMIDVPNYILTKTGVRRNVWTVYNWAKVGLYSYSKKRIKLQTEKILNQVFTRESWVDKFLREIEE
jgi:hypothetical protein